MAQKSINIRKGFKIQHSLKAFLKPILVGGVFLVMSSFLLWFTLQQPFHLFLLINIFFILTFLITGVYSIHRGIHIYKEFEFTPELIINQTGIFHKSFTKFVTWSQIQQAVFEENEDNLIFLIITLKDNSVQPVELYMKNLRYDYLKLNKAIQDWINQSG